MFKISPWCLCILECLFGVDLEICMAKMSACLRLPLDKYTNYSNNELQHTWFTKYMCKCRLQNVMPFFKAAMYMRQPSGSESSVYWDNGLNIMAADATALALLDHQQPQYWECRINGSLSSTWRDSSSCTISALRDERSFLCYSNVQQDKG